MVWMDGAVNVPGNFDKEPIGIELANQEAGWNVLRYLCGGLDL